MRIKKLAQTGSLESNDLFIMIEPAESGLGIKLEIKSIVQNQYYKRIESVILSVLKELQVEDAYIKVQDRGALDCTIIARTETVIKRAGIAL
ncbi:Citrate lyase acyl carrier protein [subsurface metagenome]